MNSRCEARPLQLKKDNDKLVVDHSISAIFKQMNILGRKSNCTILICTSSPLSYFPSVLLKVAFEAQQDEYGPSYNPERF